MSARGHDKAGRRRFDPVPGHHPDENTVTSAALLGE